jgi:hypothetical protein
MTVRTSTTSIWVDDHDVVHVVGHPGSTQSIGDARENVRAVAGVMGSRRRPLLIDMRGVKYLERDVRAYYASDEAMSVATALAVLVESEATRLMANLVLMASRTSTPTRAFADEAQALAWLQRPHK